jgi:ribosome-associated translation inhibitor RaiA
MTLSIRTHGWEAGPDLRAYVERRLGFALGRLGPRVRAVTAYLEDVNGPRGGPDKRCRLVARLAGGADVVVEDTGSDAQELIDRAANRLGRAAHRQVERVRDHPPGAVAG